MHSKEAERDRARKVAQHGVRAPIGFTVRPAGCYVWGGQLPFRTAPRSQCVCNGTVHSSMGLHTQAGAASGLKPSVWTSYAGQVATAQQLV
eukprot:366557-Chlamydomonas_euryale.AAC.9